MFYSCFKFEVELLAMFSPGTIDTKFVPVFSDKGFDIMFVKFYHPFLAKDEKEKPLMQVK